MLHEPLIESIAKTKKPIIISTGIANLKEITQSYNLAKKYKIKDITLLYCVSNYPSKSSDFNINNIEILKKKFKCKIGFSDHSIGSKISMLAVAKGAEVVEKHICLEKFNKDNIKIIRPGYGVSPIFYKKILNKKSPIKINKNNPITKKILNKIYL